MIEKAKASIKEQNLGQRYLRSKTMAISQKDLPKVKSIIQKCLHEIDALVSASEKPNSLQQINIQLFDLAPKLSANQKLTLKEKGK